ncbi:MAG: outer membrane lipid asymmetry maintenance protein MlaD [Desulfovibrionaceae bacterium]|jgi:phospholipid/cholesterol/gamma-HCH transport system substrate-binding protein|nr:outer membrane lipid asymmetry maintenance protein MlaD [Desulfovibrionaceae bacterium]
MHKYGKETWVGIFVLIGLLCVGYLTIKLGKMEVFSDDGYMLTARFANVSGLRTGADVELAGVPVGKVAEIRLDPQTDAAILTLRIQKGVALTDDVIASVKTSGLIGDKYVKLAQGGSPDMLADGDRITETESAVDIQDLIGKYAFGDVEKK